MAEPGHDGKPRRRSCRGRGEESDGCVVPVKPRTKPTTNRWRRWWREGGRPEGRRAATHAPDSVPDTVCHRSCEPADWGCMGRQSPEPQSRWTFGRSPVRGSRTPGSARGGPGQPGPLPLQVRRSFHRVLPRKQAMALRAAVLASFARSASILLSCSSVETRCNSVCT